MSRKKIVCTSFSPAPSSGEAQQRAKEVNQACAQLRSRACQGQPGMGMRTKTEGQQPREWTSGMDRNTGMPYFIPEPMPILTLPRQCQLVLRVVGDKSGQSDHQSIGMREVVSKAARVEHIVGKTLGVTASFAPVYSQQRHYSQAEKWAVGGAAHAHMKIDPQRTTNAYVLQHT